jgi:outer membrane murein-binding lipoprotein Lpp
VAAANKENEGILSKINHKESKMKTNSTSSFALAALAAGALLVAGCSDKPSTGTVGQKVDQAADKVAATTSQAADKVAVVADDSAITAKVKAAMLADPGLKALQISVDTKDGTVTLTGTVDNSDMREKAKQVASSTNGVKGVIDQLSVKAS